MYDDGVYEREIGAQHPVIRSAQRTHNSSITLFYSSVGFLVGLFSDAVACLRSAELRVPISARPRRACKARQWTVHRGAAVKHAR
jgi:hypothetical protein